MKKLTISHTILYTKGHYQKGDNMWEDLKVTLGMDGYQPFTKHNVITIITNQLERSGERVSLSDLIHALPEREMHRRWFTDDEFDTYDCILDFILLKLMNLKVDRFDNVEADVHKFDNIKADMKL